jgi:hypothetical protein
MSQIIRDLLLEVLTQSRRSPYASAASQETVKRLIQTGTDDQCREALTALLRRADRLVADGTWAHRTVECADLTERIRQALLMSCVGNFDFSLLYLPIGFGEGGSR